MSETKNDSTASEPTYIITSPVASESAKKGGVQKKYVIFGVVTVLIFGLIIAAVLIGMHMFTEAQKEIVRFSFEFKGSKNNDVKQDVEADPNDNVVMYHVTQEGQDAYIVNDFNRLIQVVKLTVNDMTQCFVTPLNISEAMKPSEIVDAKSMTGTQKRTTLPYQIATDPVVDRSFLPKKAADMCSGISLYWVHKKCLDSKNEIPTNSTQSDSGLSKRAIYYMGTKYGMGGLGGCCWAYWACYVRMTEYFDGYYYTCDTYIQTNTCCGPIAYPYCQNIYYQYWYTPGMVC